MKRKLVLFALQFAFLALLAPRLHGQDPAHLQKMKDLQQKIQACGTDQQCLESVTKQAADVAPQIGAAPSGPYAKDLGMPAEEWVQRQCNVSNEALYPFRLQSCLPVSVQVTDSALDESYLEGAPVFHRALTYTAVAKGKLLYDKDFTKFLLLVYGAPENIKVQNVELRIPELAPDGMTLRNVDHPTTPRRIGPFWLQIDNMGWGPNQGPMELSTHNLLVVPAAVFFGPGFEDVAFGTVVPDTHLHEPMITAAVMKGFVNTGGFERTYQWESRPSDRLYRRRMTFKVVIGNGCGDSNVTLAIRTVDGKTKYKFSDAKPAKLEVTLQADVTPASYANDVQWELPDILGSQRQVTPQTARGPTVTVSYTNLPQHNDDFGKKTVRASVNTPRCTAQAEKELQFFFPRDATNNPGGKNPNWFYYWTQTAAAKPSGQYMNIEYGGLTFDRCAESGIPAIFKPGAGYKTIHVCDLSKLGSEFKEVYPLLDHTTAAKYLGTRTVTGIDTFAAAIIHEYQHYLAYHNWREGKSTTQLDAQDQDRDGIPDSVEPSLGYDPTKFQTYLPNDPKVGKDKVGGDEEWMAYEAMRGYAPGTYDKVDWASPGKQW